MIRRAARAVAVVLSVAVFLGVPGPSAYAAVVDAVRVPAEIAAPASGASAAAISASRSGAASLSIVDAPALVVSAVRAPTASIAAPARISALVTGFGLGGYAAAYGV